MNDQTEAFRFIGEKGPRVYTLEYNLALNNLVRWAVLLEKVSERSNVQYRISGEDAGATVNGEPVDWVDIRDGHIRFEATDEAIYFSEWFPLHFYIEECRKRSAFWDDEKEVLGGMLFIVDAEEGLNVELPDIDFDAVHDSVVYGNGQLHYRIDIDEGSIVDRGTILLEVGMVHGEEDEDGLFDVCLSHGE